MEYGIIPFVVLQIVAIIAFVIFPQIITWLPQEVYQEEFVPAPVDQNGDVIFPSDSLIEDNLAPDF